MDEQTGMLSPICEECGRMMQLKQVKNPEGWGTRDLSGKPWPDMPNGIHPPYKMVYRCASCETEAELEKIVKQEPEKKLVKVECANCGGTGMVECSDCDGDGYVKRWEED